MTGKPDLDLYATTERVRCRVCHGLHRVPVLYERQHMGPIAEIAVEPSLASSAHIKTIQVPCPAVEYPHMPTSWNLPVPHDEVYVAHGEPRL